jgi:hypothetical protein
VPRARELEQAPVPEAWQEKQALRRVPAARVAAVDDNR